MTPAMPICGDCVHFVWVTYGRTAAGVTLISTGEPVFAFPLRHGEIRPAESERRPNRRYPTRLPTRRRHLRRHNSLVVAPDGADAIAFHSWDAARTRRQMRVHSFEVTPDGPVVGDTLA